MAFAGCGRWGSRRGRGPWRWANANHARNVRDMAARAIETRPLRARPLPGPESCRRRSAERRRWGGRPERTPTSPGRRTPATLWILVVSNASSKVNGGRRGGAWPELFCRSRAGRSSGCCDHRRTGFSARAWRSAGLGQPGGAYQHLLQSRTLRIRTLMTEN